MKLPWERPYDAPDEDDSPQMVVMPGGALVDPEWLQIERELARREDERIRARAEEREATFRAAEAEKAAERDTLKREILEDLRGAGETVP
jgi:hypothetical protein